MEGNATGVVGVRRLNATSLDDERIETAVAVSVLPLADRGAAEARLDIVREFSSVGVDAAQRLLKHEVGYIGGDDDLHWLGPHHHPRNTCRNAACGRVHFEPAVGCAFDIRLEDRPILRRQRGLLAGTRRLGRVPR